MKDLFKISFLIILLILTYIYRNNIASFINDQIIYRGSNKVLTYNEYYIENDYLYVQNTDSNLAKNYQEILNILSEKHIGVRKNFCFFEIINLLSICRYFKIEKGLQLCEKLLFDDIDIVKDWIENNTLYQNKNNYYDIISYNIEPSVFKWHGLEKHDTTKIEYANSIPIAIYFDSYANDYKEKIQQEIEKINILNSSLHSFKIFENKSMPLA